MSPIVEFVEKYIQLTQEERKILEVGQSLKKALKKEVMLSGYELTQFGVFVVEGICCLQKLDEEGQFKVLDFYFQGEPILSAFEGGQDLSCYSLVAVKDCKVLLSDAQLTEIHLEKYPKFERVCRIFAEEQLRKSYKIGEILKISDPSEKLNALNLWRPNIFHQVPKSLIANFLGMRAETLSRATRRFSEN